MTFDARRVKKLVEQDGFLAHIFNLAMDDDAVKDSIGRTVVPGDEAKALRRVYDGCVTMDAALAEAYEKISLL